MPRTWQIIINGPGYFDTPYDLPDGSTTMGRAEENDVVLSGDLVSRRHARLKLHADKLMVEDLGSRNGTRVNGQPVTGGVLVKPGDVVSVGENNLSVRDATNESRDTEILSDGASVRWFGHGREVGAVVVSKNLSESAVLQVLDNVAPFDLAPPFSDDTEPSDDRTPQPMQLGSLFLLFKTAELLATSASLQAFLEAAMDRFLERVQAVTAVVLVRQPSGTLVPYSVRHGTKLERGEVPVSDAIVAAALTKGTALAVADVREDIRFRSRESVVLYGADQVICSPIGRERPFQGVIYLSMKGQSPGQLESLVDLTTAMGHLIATALAKFGVAGGPGELKKLLERFHPPEVAQKRLGEVVQKGAKLLALEDRSCTVLYAELYDFAQFQQKNAPEKVGELLTELHTRFCGIVFSFGGSVTGGLGDGLQAVFGAPYSKGDEALRAVRAALALRQDWIRQIEKEQAVAYPKLRFGLAAGRALTGFVGPEGRAEFVAVGEPAMFASAVCGLAEAGQVIITAKTLTQVGARFDVNVLGERVIHRGAAHKVAVFEVLEEDSAQLTAPGLK